MRKIITIVLAIFVLVACNSSKQEVDHQDISSEQSQEQVLKIGSMYDFKASYGAERSLVFDSLTYLDKNMEAEPYLVSWTVSDDGKTYDLSLLKDVKFHDGTPLTAETIKWNIESLGELSFAGYTQYLDSVEIIDDHNLKVNLNNTYLHFPTDLARIFAIKEGGIGDDFSINNYVGTGPFILDEETDKFTSLKLNEDYWNTDKKPLIDKIEIYTIPDANSRALALTSGQVDVVNILEGYNAFPFSLIDSTGEEEGISVLGEDPNLFTSATCLGMNWQQGPCTDYYLRAALSTGIRRQELVDDILFGIPNIAEHFVGPGFWDAPKDIEGIKYDPEKSQEFFQQGGYELVEGKLMKADQQIKFDLVVQDQNEYKDVAIYLQSELERLGIETQVHALEYNQALERRQALDFDVTISWPWYTPIHESLPYLGLTKEYKGMGLGTLIDDVMFEYADEFYSAKSRSQMEDALSKIWKLQYESYMNAPLYSSARMMLFNDKFEGYKFEGSIYHIDFSELRPTQ